MEFDSSLLKYEVDEMARLPSPPHVEWVVTIITPTEEYQAIALLAHDSVCDFVSNYGEESSVEVVVGSGTYQHRILPNKENLKVRVSKVISNGEVVTRTYQALISDIRSEILEQNNSATQDVIVGDINSLEVITIQLREFAIDYIQAVMVGGIAQNTYPAKVLSTMLLSHGQDERLDTEYRVRGLTMQPPDNTEVRKQVIVKHGTPLTALGDFLQTKGGGIYSSGLGVFLLQGMWYVWGLYDLQYEARTSRLRVVMIPPRRYKGLERTWRYNGSELVIIVTDDREHLDPSDARVIRDGNAVRFVDARQVLDGFSESVGNRGIVKRTKNANEYAGFARGNGQNYTVAIDPTDNPYAEASRMVGRNGSFLQCTWENSEPENLRPDMVVRVIIDREEIPVEVPARIVMVQSYTYKITAGLINGQMQRKTKLTLYIANEYGTIAATNV